MSGSEPYKSNKSAVSSKSVKSKVKLELVWTNTTNFFIIYIFIISHFLINTIYIERQNFIIFQSMLNWEGNYENVSYIPGPGTHFFDLSSGPGRFAVPKLFVVLLKFVSSRDWVPML